jgi:hypothetical protein
MPATPMGNRHRSLRLCRAIGQDCAAIRYRPFVRDSAGDVADDRVKQLLELILQIRLGAVLARPLKDVPIYNTAR